MKNLLLLFLLLLTSNLTLSQDCGEAYHYDSPIGTISFYFRTQTLLTGNDEVSALYYTYKYEIVSNSDNHVVKSGNYDPSDYISYQNGYYNYSPITFNRDCDYDGSHGTAFKMVIIKLRYYDPTPSNYWVFPHHYSYDETLISSEQCTISNVRILTNLSQCGSDGGGGVSEEPNLTWGNVTVKVGTTTYNVNSGQTPILKKNNWADFNITVKNDDDGNAGSFACLLLVSKNNDAYPIPNSWPVYNFQTANFSGIAANSSGSTTISNYIGENIGGIDLVHNQTYYMYLHIDYNDSVDESNENDNDNVTVFAFKYNDGSGGRVAYLDLGYGLIEVPLDDGHDDRILYYNLKIYEIYGSSSPLVDQDVQDGQTIDVSFLDYGGYVVHINNVFVKKFGKLRKF